MNREIGLVSYLGTSPNWLFERNTVAKWTPEENKRFENALALFDKDTPDRWHNVASMIPGKTVSDVVKQYRELVEDVSDIEAGLIPIPGYAHSSFTLDWMTDNHGKRTGPTRSNDHERKKGVPWTEEEHRQFLLGLKKYGKGDWRNISRNFVTSRTPTQVASHAQKYFIRQVSGGKDKRRSSIHDITTVHLDVKSTSPDTEGHDSPEKPLPSLDGDVVVRATYDAHQGGVNSNLMMSHLQGMMTSSSSLCLNLHEHLHLDPHGLRLEHHMFR